MGGRRAVASAQGNTNTSSSRISQRLLMAIPIITVVIFAPRFTQQVRSSFRQAATVLECKQPTTQFISRRIV